MSLFGFAVILAGVIFILVKWKTVKLSIAILCVIFGLVIGATSFGGAIIGALGYLGDWVDRWLRRL